MKMMNRVFSLAVTAALAVGLLAGCGASSTASSTAASSEAVSSVAASSEAASAEASEAKVEKLSDALAEAGIISEEEAAAGFVTTVNGETADWDKDSAWWCLTDASGEMTSVGVGDIELHDGDSYAFTYTK